MVRKDGEAVGEKGCGLARLDFNFNHSLWTDMSVSKLQATKPMDKKKKPTYSKVKVDDNSGLRQDNLSAVLDAGGKSREGKGVEGENKE
jgi:hypothetical protein